MTAMFGASLLAVLVLCVGQLVTAQPPTVHFVFTDKEDGQGGQEHKCTCKGEDNRMAEMFATYVVSWIPGKDSCTFEKRFAPKKGGTMAFGFNEKQRQNASFLEVEGGNVVLEIEGRYIITGAYIKGLPTYIRFENESIPYRRQQDLRVKPTKATATVLIDGIPQSIDCDKRPASHEVFGDDEIHLKMQLQAYDDEVNFLLTREKSNGPSKVRCFFAPHQKRTKKWTYVNDTLGAEVQRFTDTNGKAISLKQAKDDMHAAAFRFLGAITRPGDEVDGHVEDSLEALLNDKAIAKELREYEHFKDVKDYLTDTDIDYIWRCKVARRLDMIKLVLGDRLQNKNYRSRNQKAKGNRQKKQNSNPRL